MALREWVAEFRKLHERARKKELTDEENTEYLRGREELANALLSAQQLDLKPGQTARQSLRVQRTLQADLIISNGTTLRAMTLDISIGGLAAMLGYCPTVGEPATVTLRLPDEPAPLVCKAIVSGVKRQGAAFRVSFSFGPLPVADRDRLGFVVFDTVLESLKV
jgi:hypothetical protein